jgi:hypothetical protein
VDAVALEERDPPPETREILRQVDLSFEALGLSVAFEDLLPGRQPRTQRAPARLEAGRFHSLALAPASFEGEGPRREPPDLAQLAVTPEPEAERRPATADIAGDSDSGAAHRGPHCSFWTDEIRPLQMRQKRPPMNRCCGIDRPEDALLPFTAWQAVP